MIQCKKCSYTGNPETARNCVHCGKPLDSAGVSGRGGTFNESGQPPEFNRRQTAVEGTPVPYSSAPTPVEREPKYKVWEEPKAAETGGRGQTKYIDPDAANDLAQPTASGLPRGPRIPSTELARKIVAVLITYSWHAQGQLFPIVEGRNLIGRDPAQCDICIPEDPTLSAVNSHITYRRNFMIGDSVSQSGTDLDGEPVENQFVPLHNYAKIRTGSTHWVFVILQPSTEASATPVL